MTRVVVTGMGVATPLGRSVEELWNNLLNKQTSITDITDTLPWLSDYKVRIGSIFKDYNLDIDINPKQVKRMDPFSQFALDAATEAVSDSGFNNSDEIRDRTGVAIGVGLGGLVEIEKQMTRQIKGGLNKVNPLFIPMGIPDAAAGNVTNYFGFHATECPAVISACATGASNIVLGYKNILLDEADIMVCGGTDSVQTKLTIAGFGNIGALSTNNDADYACRPFDRDRSGFIAGEGAGVVVLEKLEHAKARGANIYGELIGYGMSADGGDMTAPRKDGKYATKAMTDAMNRSKIEHVDYINTHGTSTPLNDPIETMAIKRALGDQAYDVSLNSTKSMIGHTLAASGTIEAIVSLKTIQTGVIHATRNLENEDPECDLDYTKNNPRERDVRHVLSNSFGFFGHNVVLAFAKY
jgi:3-oxoacyl-[acyl-carrier-protein] synthase II